MTAPKPYLRLILILSGIFFLLHVVFLGVAPLWGSSEAREAQVVWTIFSFDEWILPLRNGIIPSKPPLFHWLGTLLSYGLGDVTLFSVRLVSLLAATGTLFVTLYTTAILWVRERQAPPTLPILVAWFCMITTYIFLVSAGDAKVDMLFTFWVTCAVAWYLRATRYELIEGASEDLGKAYAGMWLFCALAALTKALLALCCRCSSVLPPAGISVLSVRHLKNLLCLASPPSLQCSLLPPGIGLHTCKEVNHSSTNTSFLRM